MNIPKSLLAVGRAGAGVNNIPIEKLSAKGIPVFNTPGANANAVKELVLAGMLLAARNICPAWAYVKNLQAADDAELAKLVEQGKKQFAGVELPGKTLAVIGLGAIGVKVANSAIDLGMNVIGFDPDITVKRAWELSSAVEHTDDLKELLTKADFVTVHVPLTEQTRGLINRSCFDVLQAHAVVLNFSRDGIIDQEALLQALSKQRIKAYVTDFPSLALAEFPAVIALPHLGASTAEAEQNCARMVVRQVMRFIETGEVQNAVNLPAVTMPKNSAQRLAIVNENVPNMVGQISTLLAQANLNIADLVNRSRENIAYTLVDVNDEIPVDILAKIKSTKGILSARIIN